jgi:chromosome segregation ATPase
MINKLTELAREKAYEALGLDLELNKIWISIELLRESLTDLAEDEANLADRQDFLKDELTRLSDEALEIRAAMNKPKKKRTAKMKND